MFSPPQPLQRLGTVQHQEAGLVEAGMGLGSPLGAVAPTLNETLDEPGDRPAVLLAGAEVPRLGDLRAAAAELLGQQQVAGQRVHHVLPGAHRMGRADPHRLAAGHGAHHVGYQPMVAPVAAADDVAGPGGGHRDRPPAALDAIAVALINLAQLITDIAEIAEVDINPLLADPEGVMALDARIKVAPAARPGAQRLAIRPYPRELEETVELNDGREMVVRPIRPEDAPVLRSAFKITASRSSEITRRSRWRGGIGSASHTARRSSNSSC